MADLTFNAADVVFNTLQIGPLCYTISQVETLSDLDVGVVSTKPGDEANEYLGHVKHNYALIEVSSNQSAQVMRITLVHEIIHAILEQAGYQEHSESMIEALSHGLIDVMRNNPQLLKWITQHGE